MTFDHGFAGAGLAASLLALRIVRRGLGSVLLVDRTEHDPRTFAFWTRAPDEDLDPLVEREWRTLRIAGPDGTVEVPLGAWRYAIVRADAVRERARRAVEEAGGAVVQGDVEAVGEGADGAALDVDGLARPARFVYDSREDEPPIGLVQSFAGWWVETDEDAFDPDVATLMDFRVPQQPGALRFVHVLPMSARRALVSGVCFGPEPARVDVAAWLRDTAGLSRWTVTGEERGATSMGVVSAPRRRSPRVLAVGVRGGLLKASTGYALTRIRDDADAVATSLADRGHPFALPRASRLWAFLDRVLLRVVAVHGPATAAVFVALFARNPVDRVLRFLDERAGLGDAVALVWSLPRWTWFLSAASSVLFRGDRAIPPAR